MSAIKNLLVELLVEELPPKALRKLGESFAQTLFDGLETSDFLESDSRLTIFASPRRLAAHITNVRQVSQPRPQPPKSLMPKAIGFDASGMPTAPLLKKLKSLYHDSVDVDWLIRERIFVDIENGKEVVKHREGLAAGAQLSISLEGTLEDAIRYLPIPKVMTYPNPSNDGWETVDFVRPAHGLVALYGGESIDVRVLGLKAGKVTYGHRFEAKVSPIVLKDADSYASQLRDEGAVIAGFEERRAEIVRQLEAAAAGQGLSPIKDDALLDEVTALVERPNVLVGRFEDAFLQVPQECLILTMKVNQKYFPLLDGAGKLSNKFLIVSNISPADTSAVIGGNERVVRPRLADAKFFFDQDRKKPLESRVPGLSKVVYHNKLGTQGERVERVMSISRWVAERIDADVMLADRAALLAKADLLTDMVGEFPELQGTMGGYYARHDGEHPDVAAAIADQYRVKQNQGETETNLVSASLQLADRIETLVGMWAIGAKPTGDKDPFALRRHAINIIRIFEELYATARIAGYAFKLNLDELLAFTAETLGKRVSVAQEVLDEVRAFIFERYLNQLAPLYGLQAVGAVLTLSPPLHEVIERLEAVKAFTMLPEVGSLAAANKRVGNILKKVEGGVPIEIEPALFRESAETALHDALMRIKPKADGAFESGDYTASLQALAALKAPVDAFFDGVMVNSDDPPLRANRLALLSQLHQTMNRVADLSRLAN